MDTLSDLSSWLEEWQLELDAGRPGDETIKVYLRSVRQFLAWLGQKHPQVTEPAQLTWPHARDWMASLIQAGRADATRRVRGIALRKFFGYLADQPDSGLKVNPAANFELPMPKAPPVPIISDEDLVTLLRSMSSNSFIDRRDTAIVRLLLDCGLRRAELVGIEVDDLDLQHQQVLVHGKGGRDRIPPFGGKTTLALRKYLRTRAGHPAAASTALFLSTRPGGRGGWRITGGGIAEMVSRRCVAAGLGHIHPHQFRHTWASDLKGNGINDGDLERLAGWTTPMMSRRYGNVVADQQAAASARRLNRGDRV
jgi:site-specific recombinase XerD